jgi:hypothetical protein
MQVNKGIMKMLLMPIRYEQISKKQGFATHAMFMKQRDCPL